MQVLRMLLNRSWQPRRTVITKEIISFAYITDDLQIDFIPLAEVDYVKEMNDIGEFRRATHASSRGSSGDITTHEGQGHTLQIATAKEGHNSGRLYYLQADTHDVMEELKHCIQATRQ